jgi:predicted DNA-binding transcriptional regulator AlpA
VSNKVNGDFKMYKEEFLAFSIEQFCKIHSISRAKFYMLLREGLAPKIMQVGRRRLISIESAKQWRKDMEEKQCNSQ